MLGCLFVCLVFCCGFVVWLGVLFGFCLFRFGCLIVFRCLCFGLFRWWCGFGVVCCFGGVGCFVVLLGGWLCLVFGCLDCGGCCVWVGGCLLLGLFGCLICLRLVGFGLVVFGLVVFGLFGIWVVWYLGLVVWVSGVWG